MKNKKFVGAVVSTVVLSSILAGCGSSSPTPNPSAKPSANPSPGQENKKPLAGVTLRVVGANHVWTDEIKKLIPEFEQQTGAKINLEQYFEDQLTQKITVEFTSGSSNIDVFMIRPLQDSKMFIRNGWVAPLTKTDDKDWDLNDFSKASTGSLMQDNKLFGVPTVTEREILYYRKDIFEKNNIQVPKTLEELKQVAAKLNNPKNDFYGFVARGQRAAAVTQFSSFLYGMGGDFFTDDKAALDTPEAIKAFKLYGELLKNYGPPGVLNMSWPQAMAIFTQGKAAMYTDADSLFANFIDTSKSTVADKVGFAVFPAGDKGQTPYSVTSWGLAVNSTSKQQDAAWEFIKWATSKKNVTTLQSKGIPGARQSVWNTEEGKKSFPKELADVIAQSDKIGKSYDRPLMINVGEARDIIGSVIVAGIMGEDVEKIAKQSNPKLQELLNKEKNK